MRPSLGSDDIGIAQEKVLRDPGEWQALCHTTPVLSSLLPISFLEDKAKHFFPQLSLFLEWRHGIVLAYKMDVCWGRGELLGNWQLF